MFWKYVQCSEFCDVSNAIVRVKLMRKSTNDQAHPEESTLNVFRNKETSTRVIYR